MAYPAKTWALIKADYETGNYSIEDLQKKHKISHDTITTRCYKDKWVKGLLKPQIEKSIQNKMVEAFAKRGFDESRVAEIVEAMAKAEKTIIVPSGKEEQSGFADIIPDWQARDKAVTQYAKLTGSYAQEKADNRINISINEIEINLRRPDGTTTKINT
jgi:NCAIR mutase (PurE)-related protein